MAGIGVGAGVVAGFALSRTIAKYITDIHQPGTLAFVASALVILGAAVIASAVPAARAQSQRGGSATFRRSLISPRG